MVRFPIISKGSVNKLARWISKWFKEKGLKSKDSHIGSYKIRGIKRDTLYRIFCRPIFSQYTHKIVVTRGLLK